MQLRYAFRVQSTIALCKNLASCFYIYLLYCTIQFDVRPRLFLLYFYKCEANEQINKYVAKPDNCINILYFGMGNIILQIDQLNPYAVGCRAYYTLFIKRFVRIVNNNSGLCEIEVSQSSAHY